MPAISQAKHKAKRAVCLSNMKQIGAALTAYVVNNDGKYPFQWTGQSNSSAFNSSLPGDMAWNDQLGVAGYDGRNITMNEALSLDVSSDYEGHEMYMCPDSYNKLDWNGNEHRRPTSCYKLNAFLSSRVHASGNSGGEVANMAQVESGSETIANMEVYNQDHPGLLGRAGSVGPGTYEDIYFETHPNRGSYINHGAKAWMTNFSFVDGHAKFMNYKSTFESTSSGRKPGMTNAVYWWGSKSKTTYTMWDIKKP